MKKIISSVALGALMSVASVNASQATLTGFRLGVEAGAGFTRSDSAYANTAGVAGANFQAYANNYAIKAGKAGFRGGIFAGYDFGFSPCALVGIEIFGGYDSTKLDVVQRIATDTVTAPAVNNNVVAQQIQVTRKFYYGAALRLGYLITPSTLIALKIGAEMGKFTLKDDGTAAFAGNAAAANTTAAVTNSGTVSKGNFNFLVGGSIETYVQKNVVVGLEYTYLFGPSINYTRNGAATGPATVAGIGGIYQIGGAYTNKITQHKVALKIAYKF